MAKWNGSPAPGWRDDMENAPKDGTPVDLWVKSLLSEKFSYRATNCVWADIVDSRFEYHGWVKARDDFRGQGYISTQVETPTHWMLVRPPQ